MKKNGFYLLIAIAFLTGFSNTLSAQSRFWVAGAAGNWNDTNNWATVSGGAPGASVPGAGNLAVFDANGSGNCTLDIGPTIAGITVNGYTGTIDLAGFNLTTTGVNTFTTGSFTNSGGAAAVTLSTAGLTTFNGTQFTANINGTTGRVLFNGSIFNNSVTVTKTANTTDTGTGNNTFNGAVSLTNISANPLRLGNTSSDIFNGTLSLNSGSTGTIDLAYTSAANQFNGNISITYTATAAITFGANGGTSTLAAGQTIGVAGFGGSGCGNLSLARFTQAGATAQTINLAGNNTATLTIGPASSFAGALTVSTPSIILNTSAFQAFTLTKTGTQTDNQRGGNTFNGVMTVNNQGGDLMFGSNPADAGDTWNADAIFNNTGGNRLRIAEETLGTVFNTNATFNNTSATDVQSRIQISRLAGSSTTFNGTTTIFNNGNASDIHISYDAGSLTTFNGPVIYTNSATTAASENYIGYNGNVAFTSDLQITNNTTDIIYMSFGTGLVSFGNGTITTGSFATGSLRFRNFTQTGATAQTFSLTGTASLYLGPASTFNGNVNFTAPQLYLNGCTYAGSATLEKTGATDNAGTGGNTFNGTTTITNSGSGYLLLGNTNADQFNGVTTFNNTGSYRIYFGHNHGGQTTTFATDVTLNTNKSGGADQWSYLINEGVNTSVSFGGNLTINCAGTLQSNHRILQGAGTSATYAGDVVINATNTHASTAITMGVVGVSTYNGNITVTNSGGINGVYFNSNASASSTLAATRSISIGAGGFFNGTLSLIRFTQVGATPHTLNTFSGTASLVVGPTSAFGGNVDFRAPQIYLNGCTYSGTVTIEKTGATDNAGTGGNIFTGVTTITNSGTGYLMTGNGSRDQFLSAATFNNTGSYRFFIAYNHPGQTTTFAGDVILNSAKTGGADQWSFFVGDAGASAFSIGGSLTINCSGAIRSDHRILNGVGSSAVYSGPVTINLSNSSPNTTITMGENGTSTYNGNILVSNSGGAAGITFNNGASASSVLNGTIAAGVFSSGSLNLYRFTQVGALPENLTLTGTSLLRVGPTSSFDGDVTFVSPQLLLNGATYNGVTYLEKNGATNNQGTGNNIFNSTATIVNSSSAVLRTNGNNTFNGTTTITNSGSQDILLELVSGSTYNGDVTFNNTGSSNIRVAYLGATTFNGNIVVNNPVGTGVVFCESVTATATLADTKTITVGGSGFNAGSLNLYRFTQLGGTAQTLTLTGAALLTLGPSSTFNGNVTFASPRILLNGTTYNGTATLEKTSVVADDGNGGNVFNSTATIINSGDSYLRTGVVSPDIFNDLLVITNTGASTIRMADNSAGNQFNGNIELNSTFGGGIYFGNNAAGTSTLAATRTISVGSSGVISGDIRLIRFTQVGPTPQALNLSGIAILTLGPTSSFGGDVDFRAPQLYLNGTTFIGTAYLEKEGATDNASTGGNTFGGTTTIVDSGSGYLLTANTQPDIFNGNLTVTNTGSNIIYLAYGVAGNQFNGNITVNSTLGSQGIYFSNIAAGSATMGNGASLFVGGLGFSSGNLRFRRFTQLGGTPQTLLLTGTALLELGPTSTFNGNVDFRSPQFELDGTTFNGTTYLEKTGAANNDSNGGNVFNGVTTIANSGSGYFRFAVTTLDAFNNDLTITNTGSSTIRMADVIAGTVFNGNIQVNCTAGNGIYFGNGGGNSSMIAGRTITVGGSGFSIGELQLIRFTQLGATDQNIVLTGTGLLRLGPTTTFNGNVDFRAPQLLLNGSTFEGTAYIEKTGATDNTSSGGNTFNGVTTIANSGSGEILTGNASPDIFNSDLTVTNTGTDWIRLAENSAGNQINGNVTFNNTTGTGIIIGNAAGGFATLAAGRTFNIGSFTTGELRLRRVTQVGLTTQNMTLTGTATLRIGGSTTFNGDVNFTSPQVALEGGIFNGTTSIQKNGAGTNNNSGGNIFNGTTTLTNSSTAQWLLANTNPDTYNGSVTFVKSSSGAFFPSYNQTDIFASDVATNGNSTITFNGGTGISLFTGSNPQTIGKAGGSTSPIFRRITIDKAAEAVTLNTDISVSVTATFVSGVINSDATNFLNFANNATAVGATDASYVDGPVRKTGDDPFTFPVGDNGFYRPVSISAPTGTAHFFTAQYFNANHNLGSPAVWDPSFYTVSGCEYWVVDRNTAPTSNVFVTLSWNESACNPGYITNPADLRVTRWNGTNWVDHGNGGTTGTATNGTIISSAAITSFSPITLASVSAANPLPVELAWFKASITPDNSVKLEWHTDSELNNESFDIERSQDGFDYTAIGKQQGAGTTSQETDYAFIDERPLPGRSYYRLKQNDFNGDFEYSHIVSVVFGETNEPFSVSPNPAGKEWVTFNRKVNAVVLNNLNQTVGTYNEATGFNTSELAPGIYVVRTQLGEIFRLVVK